MALQITNASDGISIVSYTYDMDGIRQSKTVNGNTTKYTTLDGKVVRETNGNVKTDYFYDNEGKPYKIVVKNNTSTYTGYYALNQQGDVIAILDDTGNVAVRYEYNAWGRILSETGTNTVAGTYLKAYNNLKYRGYYYDAETGFYYVSSRYYDPVIGRFINADTTDILTASTIALTDKNLYAYCDNNPVMRKDDNGKFWNIAIGMAIGAAVNIAATAVAAGVTGQKCDGWDFLVAGVSGALMVIPGAAPWVGLGNGAYAGIKSKSNGASWSGALITGFTAGFCASSSVSIAANLPNMSAATTGVVDFVFCTGFNSISAAVYAGVTTNASNNKTTASTTKSVGRSFGKNNYHTKIKKKSKCSAMGTGCSTDYFRYLYNGGRAF